MRVLNGRYVASGKVDMINLKHAVKELVKTGTISHSIQMGGYLLVKAGHSRQLYAIGPECENITAITNYDLIWRGAIDDQQVVVMREKTV